MTTAREQIDEARTRRMSDLPTPSAQPGAAPGDASRNILHRLRERGVIRVAASYALIAWLSLQIADVTFDPLGVPRWMMTTLIVAAVLGLPVALALAWFYELGDTGLTRDTSAEGVPRPTVPGLHRYADVIVIGVLLVAVAALLVRQSDIGRPKPPANPVIAVLPFENLGGDPAQDYFADGLAGEVLDRLGRVPGLAVIARSSSFSFRDKSIDIRTIASRLGVTTLLEGSVRRVGDRLKLNAQLIDGVTGRELWSGSFDRELTDVFAVQEELADAVIEAIVPDARGNAPAAIAPPTTDVNAYDLYLLGRQAQEARTGDRLRESVAYLERSVAADAGYARAHAALSRALVLWTFFPHVPVPTNALQRAESEAYKALALDSESSEAHAALATVMRQNKSPAAEAEYQRALELNPNNATAVWDYAVLLGGTPGREADAGRLMDRMTELDPRSGILWASRLGDRPYSRDDGKAFRAEFARGLAFLADDADALNMLGRAARSSGYAVEGLQASYAIERAGNRSRGLKSELISWLLVDDLQRARIAADALDEDSDDALPYQIEVAGLQGDYATVERLAARLAALQSEDPSAEHRQLAFWRAVQGRYEDAAEALARGEPVPEDAIGPLGANLLSRQALPAVLRIYRATGRATEAGTLARKYLQLLRADPEQGLPLAALAANEGLRDEAVAALRREFQQSPLSMMFHPELPWFRSLEGDPGYDTLLALRQKRIDTAHAAMLKLEAANAAHSGKGR